MRVLLVEDEPDLGAAIEQTLSREAYIVDWVQEGYEAWNYLTYENIEYTVAIFDWLVPGLSGIELCRQLRQAGNSLPILILTAKDRLEDKVVGLDAGADDYLTKPFGMAELLARLRALQRRAPQIQPQSLQIGNLTLDYDSRTLSCGEAVKISLTNKEFQLLEYFMRHPDRIITRDLAMTQIWQIAAEPGSNVVAAQLRLLRRKFAAHNCICPIETIYGLGYRFNRADASK